MYKRQGQVLAAVNTLKKAGWIEVDDLRILLTSEGRKAVIKHRRAIFFSGAGRPWATRSARGVTESQAPTKPYLPDLRTLDLTFFKRL